MPAPLVDRLRQLASSNEHTIGGEIRLALKHHVAEQQRDQADA